MAADAEHGKSLYESSCLGCHGESVHSRAVREARSCEALLGFVRRWATALGRHWTLEDVEDVALWLDQRHYRFPSADARCSVPTAALAR